MSLQIRIRIKKCCGCIKHRDLEHWDWESWDYGTAWRVITWKMNRLEKHKAGCGVGTWRQDRGPQDPGPQDHRTQGHRCRAQGRGLALVWSTSVMLRLEFLQNLQICLKVSKLFFVIINQNLIGWLTKDLESKRTF